MVSTLATLLARVQHGVRNKRPGERPRRTRRIRRGPPRRLLQGRRRRRPERLPERGLSVARARWRGILLAAPSRAIRRSTSRRASAGRPTHTGVTEPRRRRAPLYTLSIATGAHARRRAASRARARPRVAPGRRRALRMRRAASERGRTIDRVRRAPGRSWRREVASTHGSCATTVAATNMTATNGLGVDTFHTAVRRQERHAGHPALPGLRRSKSPKTPCATLRLRAPSAAARRHRVPRADAAAHPAERPRRQRRDPRRARPWATAVADDAWLVRAEALLGNLPRPRTARRPRPVLRIPQEACARDTSTPRMVRRMLAERLAARC